MPARPTVKFQVFAACAHMSLVLTGTVASAQTPVSLSDCDAQSFQSVLRAAPAGSARDARAVWLNSQLIRWPQSPASDRFRLYYSSQGQIVHSLNTPVRGADGAIDLTVYTGALMRSVAERFRYLTGGVVLKLADSDLSRVNDLLREQLVLVREDAQGRVRDATQLQIAAALDDLYADAARVPNLGASTARGRTHFRLWAPTAQRVSACLFDNAAGAAVDMQAMQRDSRTGIWKATRKPDQSNRYYRYLVDVFVAGVGVVRNHVTDPYSVSLSADSARSLVANLDADTLKPPGWDETAAPSTVAAATDMVIYELHVRDFSINDATVSTSLRGKYLAFTESESNGMRHMRALAQSGLTDVHLLPVFDFATVPESGCTTPQPSGSADGEVQQALIESTKSSDCFNWGYDPLHFNAPEGSYASDAGDGARRIVEFRAMVQALHRAGLRVGMDVVYNHASASGQNAKSILDRVVPGYYHRLNANGEVESSTCCANTATENTMMARLMIDSVALWARDYHIDSFRFDLMGHQPRAVMQRLQYEVNLAAGREVQLLGEGWNFGEVANGARFVQASQLSLNGSGIGTFSDRARDAVRGGSAGDSGADLVRRQGYINGLFYDPNAMASGVHRVSDLMQSADLVRVGLAGSIRSFSMRNYLDVTLPLEQLTYGGNQPAGYVTEPSEVVNYVENHDNQSLFDLNAFRLPVATSSEDRARVQILGAAINAFSQGTAYFHAGIDTLRSKSLDRNSYDSGDWFNRIDWTYQDNYFASGLPPRQDNQQSWSLMRPLLANAAIKPAPAEIAWTRDAFRDVLRLRASSTLFRLRTAEEIKTRLSFFNIGAAQQPTVLVGHLRGDDYPGAGFAEMLYLINVDKTAHDLVLGSEQNKNYILHPVHRSAFAADRRPVEQARYDSTSGRFSVPARTALVYVIEN